MKKGKLSFRSIIVITLVTVTATISFTAFYIYNHYLKKIIYAEADRYAEFERNIILSLGLLKDNFYYSIDEHDGRIIKVLLQRMEHKEQVLNSYLYSAGGKLKFSLNNDTVIHVPVTEEELSASKEEITLKSFPLADKPFSRAYIHMQNAPSCYVCHPPEQKNLGYVVIDFAMNGGVEDIAFIRKSSFLFTLTMVILIGVFILFMHYKFVRQSLGDFNSTINAINNGDLDKRLSIPETKELGKLGKNFNNMLDTFQRAQKELQEFHKKELRSNYKLATIGEMSARLAHEIRNPVTGIANAIEIIVNETKDKENLPILEEIQRQAKRVNNAISDLLKYARKKDLSLEMNDINEIIKTLVFFLKSQVKNKEIQFNLNLQDDIPLFRFDQMQMEDVLLNLGINAIQAIPEKGSITIKTDYSEAENRVYIYVADTGKGIAKDDLARIFHPFFTTRNEGTGLGLSIVKDIIDKHGGEIWVENNAAGGCTFTISLPVEKD
jgi:two-component system NtrC family sensor kinase